MKEELLSIIRRLKSTGEDGFEGLIKKLLENLTGLRFYLAKSGYQAGRDLDAIIDEGCIIAIECKRFLKKTELRRRELLGELEQASQATPFLDLWILVTTKQIDSLSRDQLLIKGFKENIEILFFDTKNFHPYSLDLLFASGRDIVLKFTKEKFTDKEINIQKIKEYLDGLTDKKEYNLHKKHLLDDLIRSEISYQNWKVNQNKWLLAQFSSKERSKASFYQCINVNDKNIKLIERQEVNENLNNWLESWKNEKCIFALLGEEGDGKTWSAAAWITELIKKENSPPVVFSDSNSLNSEEIGDILYQAVCKNRHSNYKLNRDKWIKRFNKWLDRPGTEEPLIILVIDGVNENFSYKWKLLFEKLNNEDWNGKVGVILTCRKVFWEERFSKLKDFRVKTWTLKSFNDAELNDALEKNGLKYSDFPQNIFKLLRKPRYFDLAARYRDVMSESGDITIERLIYEDSKDRFNRNFRKNLSDRDFNTFIIKRAEKYREGAERFSYSELKSDIFENLEELINELRTSGVIITNPIRNDIFTVEKRRLEYGLGILLVDQLSQNPELSSIEALEESFGGFMEPYQDMDIMVRIMNYALICAIEKRREVSKDIIFLLLYKLLESRNLNDLVWDSFPAYFPSCPDIYFEVAESIYTKDNYNPMGRKIVLYTFAKWIEKGDLKIIELFKIKFEEWLGYVYINDTIYTRISDKKKVEKNKKRIIRIVNNNMVKQALFSLNYKIRKIENSDISWISDLALAVISFTDCNYFLRAVIAGVISDAIMGYPERSEEFAWIIRANKKKVWNNLKKEVVKLIDTGVLVAKQAAYRLLSYEGRQEAISLKAELSKNISMKDKLREDHEKDPCKTIFALDKSNYYKCLNREDINFNSLIKKVTKIAPDPDFSAPLCFKKRLSNVVSLQSFKPESYWSGMERFEDFELEMIEILLCKFHPEIYAEIIRKIIGDIGNRKYSNLFPFVARFIKHYLIITPTELKKIRKKWLELINAKNLEKEMKYTEAYLFMILLSNMTAEEQLEWILKREDSYLDLINFEIQFKRLSPEIFKEKIYDLISDNIDNISALGRILFFISKYPSEIPGSILSIIFNLITRENIYIREKSVEIIWSSHNLNVLDKFVKGSWKWKTENSYVENYFGSCILAEYGKELSYIELKCRIFPNLLGYAVKQRGLIPSEMKRYFEDINTFWEKSCNIKPSRYCTSFDIITDYLNTKLNPLTISVSSSEFSKSVELKSRALAWDIIKQEDISEILKPVDVSLLNKKVKDFVEDCNELLKAGNTWFSKNFLMDCLKEVILLNPEVGDKWLRVLNPVSEKRENIIYSTGDFYYQLCVVLFEINPEKGIELYQRLKEFKSSISYRDKNTKIEYLKFSLFRNRLINHMEKCWVENLEECNTDIDLLEFVVVNQIEENDEWLMNKIRGDKRSELLIDYSRGLTLLGFLENDSAFNELSDLFNHCQYNSWIKDVINHALNNSSQNRWAKSWFEKFWASDNDVESWAAFRIFLRCVDRRYWIWKQNIVDKYINIENYEKKEMYLEINFKNIQEAIGKNEKDLKNTFLGRNISKGKLKFWM